MCAQVSEEPPVFRARVGEMLVCCAMIFLLVGGVPLPQGALAQSPDRSGKLREADQVLLRNIYRFRPELADRLEKTLEAADGYQESRRIVKEFHDRLQKEYSETIKIPRELMDRDRMEKYATEYQYINEYFYFYIKSDPIERYSDVYRFDFENDVINKAHFKDYKELYDFLRKKYPENLGAGFLAKLERLRKNDRASYIKALHRLIDELKEFRAPSSSTGSPCKIICNHPAQPPQARAWCKAHCRDEINN